MDNIEIIKSHRKTFSIEIKNIDKIIIRVPLWAKENHINEFLEQNKKWILKKTAEMKSQYLQKPHYTFQEGETFPCYGNNYTLKFIDGLQNALESNELSILINSEYKVYAKDLIINWYKIQAKNIIIPRAYHLSQKYNLPINEVKINSAKKRYGSCSSKKNLNFSWRLILAPKQIVDYLIVHELAHTVEMNHSKKFWQIVSSILPNYKIYEQWLKDNFMLFDLEN